MKITSLILAFILILFVSNVFGQQKLPFNKDLIPQPVFEENPKLVDLYWKTWDLAYDHIKEQKGIPQSPYIDEAFDKGAIWIWDTEFMVLFCKYSPKLFPGIESLNNFYKSILDKQTSALSIHHPDNPPFFAWVENDYFKFTNDRTHLTELIKKNQYLQRHYQWFDSLKPGVKLHFRHTGIKINKKKLGYNWGNVQSGMDNTPRGRGHGGQFFWVDAIAQQALSALYISRLSKLIGETKISKTYAKLYEEKKAIINKYYWDEKDGFYYDISEKDSSFIKVRTPTSYWVMLAEIPSKKQANRLLHYAKDSMEFGGKYPWPTVSRRDADYENEYGDYWKGAIWIPTAYMATKALEKYGYYNIADENAYNLLKMMLKTYETYKPATIWECYSPSKPEPSKRITGNHLGLVRPDFCGWSALAPISMFIENVLGFHVVDAQSKTIEWRKYRKGVHGIRNLQFGEINTDIIASNSYVEVKSNNNYTLIINGKKHKINKGTQMIKN